MYPGLLGILINLIAYQLYSFKFTFTFNNLNFDYDEFTKCLFIMLYTKFLFTIIQILLYLCHLFLFYILYY